MFKCLLYYTKYKTLIVIVGAAITFVGSDDIYEQCDSIFNHVIFTAKYKIQRTNVYNN